MSYIEKLENRLTHRSDELEEKHLDAAIDAQVSVVGGSSSNSDPIFSFASLDGCDSDQKIIQEDKGHDSSHINGTKQSAAGSHKDTKEIIFDDYCNPNAVHNCLSPYVPSAADRIKTFIEQTNLKRGEFDFNDARYDGDTILDIGCGDGRVCIASAKMADCKAIGLDVSPLCISMAKQLALEERVGIGQCNFFEIDATIVPERLFSDSCPIKKHLESVTVIFLYTYPTLLMKLVPLLALMTSGRFNVRKVVTLTYHLPPELVVLEGKDEEFDICFYSKILDLSEK